MQRSARVSATSSQILQHILGAYRRHTRCYSRRIRKRMIFKNGDCNVDQGDEGNVVDQRKRYIQDIFVTLINGKWRWILTVFVLSFIISWTIFAIVWWLIALVHGDLEYGKIVQAVREAEGDEKLIANGTFTMCVAEIYTFTSALLFSIETQNSIGYGYRHLTEECKVAIFVMCLQCCMGVLIQAFTVGIFFAKLSKSKNRAQTLLFSKSAVICQRSGVPCFMFRVGDMRKKPIIKARVIAKIIRQKVTCEGEVLPFYQEDFSVSGAGDDHNRLILIGPTTIVHRIDEDSPLYGLTAQTLPKEQFEIIVMLEGVVESTGMLTQARTSYLPSEILWGHRFQQIASIKEETGEYQVDYTLFDNTYEVGSIIGEKNKVINKEENLFRPSRASIDLHDHCPISNSINERSKSIPSCVKFNESSLLKHNGDVSVNLDSTKTDESTKSSIKQDDQTIYSIC